MKKFYLVVIALLLLLIIIQWLWPVQAPNIPDIGSATIDSDEGGLLAQADRTGSFPSVEAYQSIKDRPLFFEGRRPPPPYVPDANAKPKPRPGKKSSPPRGKLTGVVVVGKNTYAMVTGTGKNKGVTRVKLGDNLLGWKVEKITLDKLVLNNGSEQHEMPLRQFKTVPLPKATVNRGGKNKVPKRARSDKRLKAPPAAARMKE